MNRPRDLPNLQACGNDLCSGKHLGNTVENKIDGTKLDLKQKKANYISKENELLKEFSFAHPETLLKVNQVYNTQFTGSSTLGHFL